MPSNPPPPNITALPFQTVGNATLKRILGAVLSTGEMLPLTRQYSGMAVAPLPLGAVTTAVVTAPPLDGRPIEAAGIAMPASCVQLSGVAAGGVVSAGDELPPPPHAASKLEIARAAHQTSRRFMSFIASPCSWV